MLTPQDVVSAYKLVLGREPESSTIVDGFVAHSDFDQLRRVLLGSSEFAGRLKQNPDLLAIPMVTLAVSREARSYRKSLDDLAALSLAIWDKSVLLVGDDAASLAMFFLDRLCRVAVSAAPDTLRLLEMSLASAVGAAANVTLIEGGLAGPADSEARARYDVVYGDMPKTDADGLRDWLDDMADASADIMLVNGALAPGRSEEVFVAHDSKTTGFMAVPTRAWLIARLRERFERVYMPRAGQGPLARRPDVGAEGLKTMLLASRKAIDSPELTECSVDQAKSRVVSRV